MQINGKLIRGSKINGLLVGVEPTPPKPATKGLIMECYVFSNNEPMKINTLETTTSHTGVISWGDGTIEPFNSSESIEHIYNETGTYTIIINCDITEIRHRPFEYYTNVISIILPETLTLIGNGVFQNHNLLESVILPNSLVNIGEWAFDYCKALSTINIPKSVETIGWMAFNSCDITIIIDKAKDSISGAKWGATNNAQVKWVGA